MSSLSVVNMSDVECLTSSLEDTLQVFSASDIVINLYFEVSFPLLLLPGSHLQTLPVTMVTLTVFLNMQIE